MNRTYVCGIAIVLAVLGIALMGADKATAGPCACAPAACTRWLAPRCLCSGLRAGLL